LPQPRLRRNGKPKPIRNAQRRIGRFVSQKLLGQSASLLPAAAPIVGNSKPAGNKGGETGGGKKR